MYRPPSPSRTDDGGDLAREIDARQRNAKRARRAQAGPRPAQYGRREPRATPCVTSRARLADLTNRKIYAYDGDVRRKPGTLLPLEITILETAIDLRERGEEEFHGFAVAKQIGEHAGARTLTAHGTLYKALERMQRAGLLESRWEDPNVAAIEGRPRRRLYHVTGLGAQAVPAGDTIRRAPASQRQAGLAPS